MSNLPAPLARDWRSGLERVKRAVRQVFGVPDYGRYLTHMQRRHPDAPVLSEREFHVVAIDRRYGGSRPKCC